MPDVLERLKAALSNRYEIEREIGSGGMATVYIAEDLKHRRKVAVKVLRPELAAAIGPDRFLHEIETTAGLHHPHILPLHDSGEADGFLYYVMPYVEGESLRERLSREKQLPVEDALKIAGEVADALASAHSRGVVHRDVKPENILLEEGHAVLSDFGISRVFSAGGAEQMTETGYTVGTPTYMSPEQASGERELDGRSDVYSLGCVLYEMLGGDPPFSGSTPQAVLARKINDPIPSLRVVRDTVPDELEQVVVNALARSPADRFATAAQFSDSLGQILLGGPSLPRTTAVVAQRRPRWRRYVIPAAAIAAVILILVFRPTSGVGFNERDWIFIGDLENNTGDSVFDRSLQTALVVAIDQSAYVNVFPRNRAFETLRRMGQDTVTHIDVTLASEIAQRENLKAVLSLSIANLDDTYILTTRLLDPATGAALRSRDAQAEGKASVLESLDDLARGVRRDLGESLRSIRQRDTPLPMATTPSLDALKLHADAAAAWSASQWEEARTLWLRAIELDSNFAWAHASLGNAVSWLDDENAAEPHFEKALSLLNRVTEKERLWITSLAAKGDESIRALRAYLQQYPDDRDAWYNLGNGLRVLNRPEEALEAYDSSLAIDSLQVWAYVNSAVVYDGLGRFEESAAAFARSFELRPQEEMNTWGDVNRISGFVLVKLGDTTNARLRFEKLLSGTTDQQANAHRSLGLLEMYRGRYQAGIERLREAILLNRSENALLSEYRNRLYLATAFRAKGNTSDYERQLEMADRLTREMGFVATSWLVFLGGHYATSGAITDASRILDTMTVRATEDPGDLANVEYMRGLVALAGEDVAGGLESLELAQRLWPSDLYVYAIGQVSLANGNLDRAESAFLEILERMGLGWETQEVWLNAHYHLGRVYEAQGDTEHAIEYYQRLLDLWADGDDDLVVLEEARARLVRLAAEPVS